MRYFIFFSTGRRSSVFTQAGRVPPASAPPPLPLEELPPLETPPPALPLAAFLACLAFLASPALCFFCSAESVPIGL